MTDFEDRVRAGLQTAALDAPVAGFPRSSRGRIRRRQAVGAAVVLTAFVTIGASAVGVLSMITDRPVQLDTARSDDPRGTGGTYPCSKKDLESECVATGRYRGTSWWLGAYVDEKGLLCLTDWQDGPGDGVGGGSSCGEHDPSEIGLGISVSSKLYPGIATGEVGPEVARVVVAREDHAPIELELYPAPDDFPLDVRFYNVFLPFDATAVVGFNSDGEEIARQDIARDSEMEEFIRRETGRD